MNQNLVNAVAEHAAKQAERSALSDEMNTLVQGSDKFTAENKTRCEEIQLLIDGNISKGVAGLDREIYALSLKIVDKPVPVVEKQNGPSAFQKYLVGGEKALNADEQEAFLKVGPDEREGFKMRTADALIGPVTDGTSTDGQGVGIDVYNKVIESLEHFGGVREMCHQFGTATGANLQVPNWDTTDETGQILGTRGMDAPEEDLNSLSETKFGAYTYSSNPFGVSIEYLQDAAFSLETLIPMRLMRRIGRIQNDHFTTGDDSSKPQGLVTNAKAGIMTENTTDPTLDYINLVDMIHDVDPAYREGMEATESDGGLRSETGRVGFMFHDDMVATIKKLEDTHGRPLWLPNMGIAGDAPNTILGFPYSINQHLSPIVAGQVSALFGNFAYYGVRNVGSMTFHRFTDYTFQRKNQVGFLAFSRNDGRYMGGFTGVAGTTCNAVTKLTFHA